ncbi:TIGR03085 family metal-binding protein [Dietzia sp.]|uniref:TIGR03085 family metal-binding protein n=1 Tax=Dietzia sp. TaxID=1871616 RepID=UPI002FD8B87E
MRTAVLARNNLTDLMLAVGPDAPTLCEGWRARDLAAHLVVRERRPDSLPGILLERFAAHTEKVQNEQARTPFTKLIDLIRSGPPKWSPMSFGPIDQATNLMEYAIHAEDIRRANEIADLPEMPAQVDDDVWNSLPMFARMTLRSLRVGVIAQCVGRPDATLRATHKGQSVARLVGAPRSVALAVGGRGFDGVKLEGPPDALSAVRQAFPGL